MKNLPYFKGGTCEKTKIILSFNRELKELEFTSFEDFCKRAEIIFYTYSKNKKIINLSAYKKYIYSKKLSDSPRMDNAMKDKCLEWILSSEYEPISKNDLYSLLGLSRKGKK